MKLKENILISGIVGRLFSVFLLTLIFMNPLQAQNYESEEDMIKAADVMFENDEFAKAKPLYSQLVSLYPKDATYNVKYGYCLLQDDADKSACLKYLKYGSSKSESGVMAHYYFARGLHSNYDFSKAIKQYKKFKEAAGKKELEKYQVDRQIEMCENGKQLLKNVYELNVLDKQELSQSDFFRVYDLGEIGGKIIVKPDEFKSKLDLKNEDLSLIHLPGDAKMVYYSGYGDDKSTGKDIFRIRKKDNNTWGEPENLGNIINTSYDEDFPFMHPDGTLYFASKGHNSMGGFDLFKSEYNESTGTWSKPENLNFAISSSFDDVMFISDAKNQLAYFASSRSTSQNKYNVYRVQISRKPFDKAFLAGNFIVEGGDNEDIKNAKIIIYDLDDNQKVGTFFTNKQDGSYAISLPKSGKTYKFVVETDENSPVHTGKVEIPEQEELVSLKQEIRLVGSGDEQKLVIKNMFNETQPVDEESMLALIRSNSDLEVNVTEAEVMESLASSESAPSDGSVDMDIKEGDLIKELEALSAELNNDVKKLNNQIAFGFKYSFEKAVVADQMYDQVEVSRQNMLDENDRDKKNKLLKELVAQREKLDPIASDAIVSYDFTKSLANEYDEKLNDLDQIKSDIQNIKSGDNNMSEAEKKTNIDQFNAKISDIRSMRSVYDIAPQRYDDLLVKANEKLSKEEGYYKDVKRDIESLRLKIADLDIEIQNAKNKKAKDQLMSEKGTKEIDLQDLQYEFENVTKKYKGLKTEVKNLESDSRQINAFIAKIKSNTTPIAQLNSDDQEELNKLIDFLKEQRLIEDVIGDEMAEFIAQEDRKDDLTKAHVYPATDNTGKSIDYEEKYLVNLAAIELITDEESRYKESAVLYENWANTVKEDREIKENDLAYTKEKSQKQIIEERIKLLDEKEREYRSISVEYQEKAAALTMVAVVDPTKDKEGLDNGAEAGSEEEIAEARDGESQTEKEKEQGQGGDGLNANGSKLASAGPAKSVGALLIGTAYVTKPGKNEIQDVNESYEKAKEEMDVESDDPAGSVTLAAFEIQWARSINELIKEKEAQLAATENQADWPGLQEAINNYKAERDEHIANASGEFTAIEMEQQMQESPALPNDKYMVAFDPENPGNYKEEYEKLVVAVENHQILTPDEKNRELSLIHNYWSKTIQDDILWHENDKTKLKTQAEINEINNRVMDLTSEKKVHINLSNEFYQKYKNSTLFSDDVAVLKEDASKAGIVSKGEANTFGDYAVVYSQYQEKRKADIAKIEGDMEEVGSKGEKQQMALSLALLKRQQEDEVLAVSELEQKEEENLMSDDAERVLAQENAAWQEEAEDYVFTKKNFVEDVPENSAAFEAYKDAKEAYNDVQYLESQKAGLLTTSVVNKNAEAEVIALEDQIEEKKIEAYKALAEAGKAQYTANRKEIETLMEANPGLEQSNPKLYRNIQAADVIYQEVEKYQKNAEGYKSNSLKFDIYDQAQYMSEYVITEQKGIIAALKGETYTGELAFMAAVDTDSPVIQEQVSEFKITQAEMDAILINPIYVEYEEDRRALEEIRKERISLEAEVINEEKSLQALIDERNMIVQTAAGQKKGKKKKLMKEAEVIEQQIEAQQKQLDSVTLVMVQLKEQENNINRNSARLLKEASVDDRYKMVMLAELRVKGAEETAYVTEGPVEAPEVEEPVVEEEVTQVEEGEAELPKVGVGGTFVAAGTTLGNDEFRTLGTEIPEELEGDLFITAASSTVSPYNENKPIPVDVDMPKGVVFKVQVGAYRNAIPQDLFKGFAPLMGESLDNGITRYTAGLFRDFTNANKAKNEIRKMGYDDAFVVAFVDGKRISFQELQGLDDMELNINPATADNTIDGVPIEVFNTPSIIDDEGEISSAIAVQTTNAKEVQGLFFTVQVGVYTNTLVPEKLKAFRELNSELISSNQVRYTVGQFKTMAEAQSRRDDVQSTVSDAFVTAYENGSRITVGEALQRINQNGQ